MSGKGPLPKANKVRRNTTDTSHLQEYDVPERLKKLHKRSSYSALTLMWWDTWAHSEQAQYFSPTDWMRLQSLALLYEKFVRTQSHFVAAEIRQSESLLGATIGDRMRLKVSALKEQKNREKNDEPPPFEADMELFAELNDE